MDNLTNPPRFWKTVTQLGGADTDFTILTGKKVWAKGFRVNAAGNVTVKMRGSAQNPGDSGTYDYTFTTLAANTFVSAQFCQVINATTTVASYATTGMDIALSI